MKNYKLTVRIDYYEPYLPPRCRKYRYEWKNETIKVPIRTITSDEAPIAFKLSDYSHVEDHQTVVRCFRGKLYKQMMKHNTVVCYDDERYKVVKMEDFEHYFDGRAYLTYDHKERNRDYCIKKYKELAKQYLIIDNLCWMECGEPRYVVVTFGLGHNHGGTGLFVDTYYNPNISNKNYFSALNGKAAVEYANQVAARRGDTEDVGKFEEMIEVLMPECVKIKPMKQHGSGNKIINTLNAITEKADSAMEAGLLVMCFALQ